MKLKTTGKTYFNENYQDLNIIHVPLKTIITSPKIRQKLVKIIKKSQSIADLGCGHGGTLKLFRGINPTSRLIGVDCSDVALKKAKMVMSDDKNYQLVDTDLSKTKLTQKNLSLVYCSQLLEHLSDSKTFLTNINHSLGDNGTLLLSTVYKKNWAWYFYKNIKGEIVLAPDHINEYSEVKTLQNQLKNAGFKVEDYDLTLFRYPIIDIFLRPAAKFLKGQAFFNFSNSPFIMQLRHYLTIPIIGFYNFQIIAKKI